jgi:small conductance mechanosensitive channel
MDTDQIIKQITEMAVEYGPKLIGAIIVWIVGFWVIKFILKGFSRVLDKGKTEASLKPFLNGIVEALLKIIVVLSVLGIMGIQMTSFIAILGAVGLAVGMALSGTLQNFAGGVMILILKPFKVGDLIETQGHLGVVKEIQIFVTVLLSPENKTIIIPNGPVSNNDLINYTVEGLIRVDMTMGISYDSDIKKAREVLMNIMTSHPKVLKTPAPFVGVSELADSSVNLAVRPYSAPEHYWDVYFDVYEAGKEALDAAKITIPFPQVDVHMQKEA